MDDSWGRDTPWHQGAVVERKVINCEANNDATHFMAISHSCDVASDQAKEPHVLFLACQLVPNADPALSYGKNPRLIHLDILDKESRVVFSLDHTHVVIVSKQLLLDTNVEPDARYSLAPNSLSILQDWLASRYRRHAFPDNLDQKLERVKEALIKTGKRATNSIVGYWLDYDPRDEPDYQGPYELQFYIVYDANIEGGLASATQLVAAIENICSRDDITGMITLVDCVAVASADFSYETATNTISFRWDYLSHRADNT